MNRFKPFRHLWGTFYGQGDLAYAGLECESDVESDEDFTEKRPSTSTLLMQAFSLNAWSFVTIVLLIMFIGDFSLRRCDYEDNISIWAMPDSGLS